MDRGFDGASNALGHGVGAALVFPDNQYIPFTARLGFDCTNNMAKYEACALGIQAAIDFNVKLLKVYGDSALVIHQLRGEWETKDHKLIPYQTYIKKLVEFFNDVSFHHVPKEENQMVDVLATLASMFQLTPHGDLPYIKFRCRSKPAYCYLIEEEQDGKPWFCVCVLCSAPVSYTLNISCVKMSMYMSCLVSMSESMLHRKKS